ncbi:hypothetical protein FRC17_002825 [Serendipita sp. 399]|nr:hypothetical protein FRC17_002825 [Serendipita sp. 399]
MEIETTSQTCEPAIGRLPVEILQEIFRIIARESTTIRDVRLTCQHWCHLVASDLTLLRHIAVRTFPYCRDLHYPSKLQWDHCVHSAEQLAKALECIGDARFHFNVSAVCRAANETWSNAPWYRFTTQCSWLVITHWSPQQADLLNCLPSLRALSYLHLDSNDPALSTSHSLLLRIPPNQLQVLSWYFIHSPTFDMCEFQQIFAYLTILKLNHRQLRIHASVLEKVFSSLHRLEDFTWIGPAMYPSELSLIRESTEWKFKLQKLVVNIGHTPAFSPSTLSQLEVLRDYGTQDIVPDKPTPHGIDPEYLYLPQAREIELRKPWPSATQVEAPNLERLYLFTGDKEFEYLARMTVNPQFVELFAGKEGKVLETFLSRGPFTRLTELSLYADIRWASSDGRLAQLLSVDVVHEKMPQLKTLSIDWVKHLRTSESKNSLLKYARETSDAFNNRPYVVRLSRIGTRNKEVPLGQNDIE